MALKKCVECGGTVSDKAYACPSCQCDPKGQVCRVCKKIIRLSDAVRVYNTERKYSDSDESVRDDKFVHKECLLALFPDVSAPCWDCGSPINAREYGLAKAPSLYIVRDQPKDASWGRDTHRIVDGYREYTDSGGWTDYFPKQKHRSTPCQKCGRANSLSQKKSQDGTGYCQVCKFPLLRIHGTWALGDEAVHARCNRSSAGSGCLFSFLMLLVTLGFATWDWLLWLS